MILLFLLTVSHFSKVRKDPTHPFQIIILNDSIRTSSNTLFLYRNPQSIHSNVYLDGQIKVITIKQAALLDRSNATLSRDSIEAFLIFSFVT